MEKRSYDDGCATAHGLDLIGERWALRVVREFILGAKGCGAVRASLPGISPTVLPQRREELEQASIVRRRRLPPPASASVYELTEWGLELDPLIMTLGRWAARSPVMVQGNPMGADSLILSFRTMFDPSAAAGLETSIELTFGDVRFPADIRGGRLEGTRGSAKKPDAIISADPNALAAVVYGRAQPLAALRTARPQSASA